VAWRQQGLPELVVAVNVSATQFKRGDLEQSVLQALAESGLPAPFLELELTESILIQDTDKVLDAVQRLKAHGLMLSIDDFGTGYSSLSYLKRFNVDKLKIDRSFISDMIHDPQDATIVRAIIQMARSLNLKTIAEGVENEHLLAFLRLQYCDEAQGYYFARPMPAAEFSRYLANSQRPMEPHSNQRITND
jgi:EAL domain-containing protein (putative c-di-GMP-specific phosphodiesterase class I)